MTLLSLFSSDKLARLVLLLLSQDRKYYESGSTDVLTSKSRKTVGSLVATSLISSEANQIEHGNPT